MVADAGLREERLDSGAIVRLTLARPGRGNSLTGPLLGALEQAVRGLPGAGARAAILTGEGEKAFSTGYDVEALQAELAAAASAGAGGPADLASHPLERALRAISSSPVPVVAAIRGAATGAGFELACACDLRVAGRSARFLMPPARLGIVYSASGIVRVLALAGAAATRELFLLAEPIDAARAAAIGLVNRLADDESVAEEALAVARRLAENAPLSIAGTKAILERLGRPGGLDGAAEAEVAAIRARAFASGDLAEGIAAFFERRKPRFEGR